jgi:hypothetical protein
MLVFRKLAHGQFLTFSRAQHDHVDTVWLSKLMMACCLGSWLSLLGSKSGNGAVKTLGANQAGNVRN